MLLKFACNDFSITLQAKQQFAEYTHQKAKKMSKIIAIANQKGGVGKTAVTVTFGIETSRAGKKTLILDLDPQNNSAITLDPENAKAGFYDDTTNPSSLACLFNEVVKPEPVKIRENLYLIGSSKKTAQPSQDNIYNFADCIDLIKDEFDLIILDCPPAVGLIQHGALGIADHLLIVSGLDTLSINGVDELVNTSRQTKRRVNPDLNILGILINRYRKNVKSNEKHEASLKANYSELLFSNMITETVTLKDALDTGRSLREIAKKDAEKFGLTAALTELFNKLEVGELAQ